MLQSTGRPVVEPLPSPKVDLVVRLLESQGERVLVVLPERYLRPVVPNSSRSKGVKVLRIERR